MYTDNLHHNHHPHHPDHNGTLDLDYSYHPNHPDHPENTEHPDHTDHKYCSIIDVMTVFAFVFFLSLYLCLYPYLHKSLVVWWGVAVLGVMGLGWASITPVQRCNFPNFHIFSNAVYIRLWYSADYTNCRYLSKLKIPI